MGHVYILKLRSKKWYVGYTERNSIERILEHIDKKGAKWTKKYPPLKKDYLYSINSGLTKKDEDKETLALMAKYGISNVRGGQWCMVNMPKEVYAELSKKIDKKPKKKYPVKKTVTKKKVTSKRAATKKKTPPKKSKDVICAKCNRIGHESKDCYAKTKVSGTGILNDMLRQNLKKK